MGEAYPGIYLQRGSHGPAVLKLHERLGTPEKLRSPVFNDYLELLVTRFQAASGLKADGIVGPLTWKVLFGSETERDRDLGLEALRIAFTYVGQSESPLGSNRGPFVDNCNVAAGVPLGSPWCVSFAYFCVELACRRLKKPINEAMLRTGSSSALARWARSKKRLVSRPTAGDLFVCIGGETGYYHTGFVASELNADGLFETVEGNSDPAGGANGVKVVYRKVGRRLDSCRYVTL